MALESMATLIIQKAALAIVLHSVYRKSMVVVDYMKYYGEPSSYYSTIKT